MSQKRSPLVLGVGHENYGHTARLPEAVRAALAGDFK